MRPIQLVTIAASAGGVSALRRVLSALPKDYPAAVAIVQHRSERQPDLLARVLSRSCRLPVDRVKPGERLQRGRVYLAPPRRHLVIRENGTFETIAGPKIHHLSSSANPLFETAAEIMGPAVVAVVLTGGDSDATDGVQAVKAAGGTVIAQDQASSQCFAMPSSAIKTGAVDYILPLDEIGPMLVRLAGEPPTNQSRRQRAELGGET